MYQVIILSSFIPLIFFVILFLTQFNSEIFKHYLVISIFSNQLLLFPFIGVNFVGVNEGGSIFTNLILVFSSGLPLLVLLITRKPKIDKVIKRETKLSLEIVRISWIGLLIYAFFAAFTSEYKLMPIANTLIFAVLLFYIIDGNLNFNTFLIAVYQLFSVFAAILTLTFIFKFNWDNYLHIRTEDLAWESGTYFSPLGNFFGFAPRQYGPFQSGQSSGLFSLFGFACYLGAQKESKSKLSLVALLSFGSCSGSRTFYLILVLILIFHFIKIILPRAIILFWVTLMFVIIGLGFILYKYFLPFLSPNTSTLINLTGRSTLWKFILNNWSSEGIFGHGPNTLRQAAIEQTYVGFAHAHNSFLQALWDYGIPGLLLLVLLILGLCIEASRDFSKRNQVISLVLVLLCVQSEPTLVIGTNLTTWFWLVPTSFVFSRDRATKDFI